MTTVVNTPSMARASSAAPLASPDRMDHPALRAACQFVARAALSRGLLASLLCSVALVAESGSAIADECLPPYTVAAGATCSNMVIGGTVVSNGRTTPPWANVENSGTINYDQSASFTVNTGTAAVTLVPRDRQGPDQDKTTTITNFGVITGGASASGIASDVDTRLGRLTNNNGAEISGNIAIYLLGRGDSIQNAGLIQGTDTAIYFGQAGVVGDLQNTASGQITGVNAGIHNLSDIVSLNNAGAISSTESRSLAIWNELYTIGKITNSGTIIAGGVIANGATTGAIGIGNSSEGVITLLENLQGAQITGTASGVNNATKSAITTLTNAGLIQGGENGVVNAGTIATFNNISGGLIEGARYGVYNTRSIPILNNRAGASIMGGEYGVLDSGSIGTLTNDGTINATAPNTPAENATGLQVISGGSITTLQNDGFITAVNTTKTAYGIAIKAQGRINDLANAQTISATSTTASSVGLSLDAASTLGNLNNSGTISGLSTAGGKGYGVSNGGTIGTLTNSKDITGTYAGLSNIVTGSIPIFNNNAGASITGGVYGVYDSGSIGALTNAGTIKATAPPNPTTDATGLFLDAGARINAIANNGDISASNTTRAAFAIAIKTAEIDAFNNTRTLLATSTSANATALFLDANAKIGTLTNAGSVNGASTAGGEGYGLSNAGTITNLTNRNVITGSTFGVSNTGSINTFTNHQGGGGASAAPAQKALTYAGKLPGSYFIHITSTTYYGQVVFANPTGAMTFNVDPGSSVVRTTYDSVLSNVTDPFIVGPRAGVLNRLRWYLEPHQDASGVASTDVWDLVFKDPLPPSPEKTLEALTTNANDLRNAMTTRSGAITGTMDYDCATFDAFGACLSFKARSTVSGDQSEGAGVLIAAYRLWPQIRAGAFIDYRATPQGAAGLTFSVERPIFGAFAGYDREGEGRGLQGKLTAAVNMSRVSVTRSPTLYDAEPGSGKASLNTYGVAGEVGWGFPLEGAATATPYAGLRYTSVVRGAYRESLAPGVVDYPISYKAYSQRLLTATAGLRLKGQLSEQVGYQFGLGGEFDLRRRASPYAGSSALPGLESFSLPFAAASNHFHAVGSAGLVFQIDRTQRLTGDVYLRSQAFSSQMAATLVVGYQAAF